MSKEICILIVTSFSWRYLWRYTCWGNTVDSTCRHVSWTYQ